MRRAGLEGEQKSFGDGMAFTACCLRSPQQVGAETLDVRCKFHDISMMSK
jgi:hypothetical protein